MKTSFRPPSVIADYIDNNELNSSLYQTLLYFKVNTEIGRLECSPLEILNQAYLLCEEIQNELHPEELILDIWERTAKKYLPSETSIIFSCVYFILIFSDQKNKKMIFFLNCIKGRIAPLYFQKFESGYTEMLLSLGRLSINFENVKKKADTIINLQNRELFYTELLILHKQEMCNGDPLQLISLEIDLIRQKKLLSTDPPPLADCETDEKVGDLPGIKLKAIVLLELLKRCNISTANNDLTKICKLIAFLTGSSYISVYREVQKGITLSKYHEKNIEAINTIFQELNSTIVISKDVKY